MFKKIMASLFVLTLVLFTASFQSAEAATYGKWTFVSKQETGVDSPNAAKVVYISGEANRTGETVQRTIATEYTNSVSLNLGAQAMNIITAELGYSFGVTKGKSISVTSGALNKGEYVKIVEKEQFKVTKVVLQRTVSTQNSCDLEKKAVYAYKEIDPKISFKYCHKDKKGNEICY